MSIPPELPFEFRPFASSAIGRAGLIAPEDRAAMTAAVAVTHLPGIGSEMARLPEDVLGTLLTHMGGPPRMPPPRAVSAGERFAAMAGATLGRMAAEGAGVSTELALDFRDFARDNPELFLATSLGLMAFPLVKHGVKKFQES